MKLNANLGCRVLGLVLLVGVLGCASAPPPATYEVDGGLIKGAHFKLLVPAQWSGDVLVIAHGSRPRKAPLNADLDPAEPFVAELLAEGWLVATTSYRRNGKIFADAVDDLQRLVSAIERKYGPCRQVLIEGSSLGANLGLDMVEQHAADAVITGLVAVGAALEAEPDFRPEAWTHVPHLPVLFVSNETEIEPVEEYVRRTRPDHIQPAIWQLARPGHVNLNSQERLAAVRALADWAAGGPRPAGTADRPYDATVDLRDRPSQAQPTKEGLRGHITAVDPIYGNLDTDLVAADLVNLHLEPEQDLRLVFEGLNRRARSAGSYGDVPKGKLVVFLNAEGFLRVAVNQGNAAKRLKVHAGEPIEIRPWIKPFVPTRGVY